MRDTKLIVLLSGQISSGKSTICNGLKKDYGFKIVQTRPILEKLAKQKKKTEDLPRGFLQTFGAQLDRKTKGHWVASEVQNEISSSERILIDSVRHLDQIAAFRERYGVNVFHVHVSCPRHLRLKRFIDRKRSSDFIEESEAVEKFNEYAEDPTEKSIESFADKADLVLDMSQSPSKGDQVVRTVSFLRLLPSLHQKNVDIVIGGQFGSEGKGQIAAYLSPYYDCLVRVGGPNAGHKVYNEPEPHIFRIIPSGSSRNMEAKLIIGAGAVINLEVLKDEIREFNISHERLSIHENATIITKSDITREEKLDKIGSTKQGVGAATASNIISRLKNEEKHKAKNCKDLKLYIRDVHFEMEELFKSNKKLLLEGTQGTLLSLHHGYYPHVTSRETSAAGCLAEAGIGLNRVRKIVMVTRSYPIRVQNPENGSSGEFLSNEITFDEISGRSGFPLEEMKKIEKTSVSKKLRRVAEFNWELFRKACELNTPTDIALTFTDYIDYKNQNARRYDQLSPDTTRFIDELERCSGLPVSLISTRFAYRSIIDRRKWH